MIAIERPRQGKHQEEVTSSFFFARDFCVFAGLRSDAFATLARIDSNSAYRCASDLLRAGTGFVGIGNLAQWGGGAARRWGKGRAAPNRAIKIWALKKKVLGPSARLARPYDHLSAPQTAAFN